MIDRSGIPDARPRADSPHCLFVNAQGGNGMTMQKQIVSTEGYQVPSPGFTQAVSVERPGKFLFVSGVTARTEDGDIAAPGDAAGQTRRVLDNLSEILLAAGGSLDDLVHTVTYLTDMGDLDAVQAVKMETFKGIPPASTTVQVTRLVDERQLVEIEAIAVIPASGQEPQGGFA
jgi:2-iminobutanoate/2-iminopropanoate deaminase